MEKELEVKYDLASWYGNQMKRYGMSSYNEHMNYDDPTPELKRKKEFQELSDEDKKKILAHGENCRLFGVGMYAERGRAADYYDKCGAKLPDNPYLAEKKKMEAEQNQMQ